MFCPLCKAEYREGFVVCSFCREALVPEDASDNQRNPPQSVWTTHDRREFDRVVGQLRDVAVPCHEESQGDHWLYAIARRKPTFLVFILERDTEKANQAAGVQFVPLVEWRRAIEKVAKQTCPACGTEFPAGVGQCPACKTDLLAWEPSVQAPESGGPDEKTLSSGETDDSALELVWRGGDPVTYSRALLALRESEIRCVPSQNFDHLAFGTAMPRPRAEIRVHASDLDKVAELLREFQDPFPLVPSEPPETSPPEPDTPTGPRRAGEATEGALQPPPIPVVADYKARKRNLRWGGGLVFLSLLLAVWLAGAAARYGVVFHRGLGGFRLIALVTLSAISALCGLSAFWFLYRAWAWRADKIGLLAWLFAFEGVVFLWYLAFVLSV